MSNQCCIYFFLHHILYCILQQDQTKKHKKFLKSKDFGKRIENLAKKGQKRNNLKCEPCNCNASRVPMRANNTKIYLKGVEDILTLLPNMHSPIPEPNPEYLDLGYNTASTRET